MNKYLYKKQLREGIKVEMEHKGLIRWAKKKKEETGKCPTDKQTAKKIAEAHIKEDKQYYTKLKKAKL
jgi:hypothetical protein